MLRAGDKTGSIRVDDRAEGLECLSEQLNWGFDSQKGKPVLLMEVRPPLQVFAVRTSAPPPSVLRYAVVDPLTKGTQLIAFYLPEGVDRGQLQSGDQWLCAPGLTVDERRSRLAAVGNAISQLESAPGQSPWFFPYLSPSVLIGLGRQVWLMAAEFDFLSDRGEYALPPDVQRFVAPSYRQSREMESSATPSPDRAMAHMRYSFAQIVLQAIGASGQKEGEVPNLDDLPPEWKPVQALLDKCLSQVEWNRPGESGEFRELCQKAFGRAAEPAPWPDLGMPSPQRPPREIESEPEPEPEPERGPDLGTGLAFSEKPARRGVPWPVLIVCLLLVLGALGYGGYLVHANGYDWDSLKPGAIRAAKQDARQKAAAAESLHKLLAKAEEAGKQDRLQRLLAEWSGQSVAQRASTEAEIEKLSPSNVNLLYMKLIQELGTSPETEWLKKLEELEKAPAGIPGNAFTAQFKPADLAALRSYAKNARR